MTVSGLRKSYIPLRMGMVGGGEGAFIGSVHRMAAALDGKIALVCGAFSREHGNSLATGAALGLDDERCYKDYEEMFAAEAARGDDAMEMVAIVTPNHLHVPVARAAAHHGFHIMCDKPAGINHSEVQALSDIIAQARVHYGLTHTYLGYPMVRQARHLVATGALGNIRKVLVEYPQGWLADAIENAGQKQAAWRVDPKQAGPGGAMGDIGTHAQSLAEFVTVSPMTSVSARLRSHRAGRVLDDDGEVSFTLANGATGLLYASQICTAEENALEIRVYGENGALEWRQMEPNSLIERRKDGPIRVHRAGADQPLCEEALAHCRLPSGHPEGYLEAFANLYRHFALAIRAPEMETLRYVPGMAEGLRGMAFVEAVVSSSQQGGVVIPLEGAS